MKAFTELSHEEMIALDEEAVNKYWRLHAAEQGIPIPGPQPAEFDEQRPARDVTLYSICGLRFRTRKAADDMRNALVVLRDQMAETTYDWNVDSQSTYVKTWDGDLTVKEEEHYSPEVFAEVRTVLEGLKERRGKADDALREWREQDRAYRDCKDHIWGAVLRAREVQYRRNENAERFEDYLSMCDGDAEKAWAFFEKANLHMGDGWRPAKAPELVRCADEAEVKA